MDVKRVRRELVEWLRAKTAEASASGIVVGLSGGIDSAVVAGLAKEAFPDRSLGVIMPCHSSPEDEADARLVAEAFGLSVLRVELSEVWDLLLTVIEGAEGAGDSGAQGRDRLARANLKPRLRMLTLYYLAAKRGYLVAGTENRAELVTGYFTKYGDGGVDLLPLGGLVKSQVKALAVELGVPARVIEKTPSAGLWDGQTDEAELGLTYEVIDHYLLTGEGPADAVAKIKELERASAHKRRFPPIAPVGPVAAG